jgi:hypothetical protein
MKVFIRTSELSGSEPPTVIAFYDDNADIAPDAHGPGTTVLTLPGKVLDRDPEYRRPPRLARDWRDRAGSLPVEAEANRRVEDVLPAADQAATLHELVDLIIKHGTDVSKWPTDAKNRKAEIDEAWTYVRGVRSRARSLKSAPPDLASDKAWPTRIAKK